MIVRSGLPNAVGVALRGVGYVAAAVGLLFAGRVVFTGYEYEPRTRWGIVALLAFGLLLVAGGQRVGKHSPHSSLTGIQRFVVALGTFFIVLGSITIARQRYGSDSEFTESGVSWLVVGVVLMAGLMLHMWWSKRKRLH